MSIVIKDILPDGTLTKAILHYPGIITLSIERSNPDDAFKIANIDVISMNKKEIEESIDAIQTTMLEQGIELQIPIVYP